MDNKQIAKVFKLYSQLMELHGENPFRTKAIASASFKIDKLPFSAATEDLETLSAQQGLGKGTAERVKLIAQSGTLPELEALLDETPDGVREMLGIKGLGPKKIRIIWKDLGIESIGELLYACNENRLVEAKGFGEKTQQEIKKAIEFSIDNEGWFLYAGVQQFAENFMLSLRALLPKDRTEFAGAYRRQMEILNSVDILTTATRKELKTSLDSEEWLLDVDDNLEYLAIRDTNNLLFRIYHSAADEFANNWLLLTGSEQHLESIREVAPTIPPGKSEEEIYNKLGMAYIPPVLREGHNEVNLAKAKKLPSLIEYSDLKGSLHNHSTYSDGIHTLEQMAIYCKDDLGLEYLGISDHSRTAVYAGGLTIEDVHRQWNEIDELNDRLAPFRIFKGIESDILNDGSLDYPEEILMGFDFVVASIHSALKMDEERATQRLIKAIENPYTTILGHPTGRLLLARSGYPLDFKRIIDACAANDVVIEINANPLRLDLDWRWHRYAVDRGVLLSINPDAHRVEGFHDMQYGVRIAQKGAVSKENCLNTFSMEQIRSYFDKRK